MNFGFLTRRRTRISVAAAAILLTAGLFFAFGHRIAEASQKERTVSSTHLTPMPAATGILADMENAFTAIAERTQPSVVLIKVEKSVSTATMMPDMGDLFSPFDDQSAPRQNPFRRMPRTFKTQGAGSGVIVRSDGWILTNDHVVGGADKVTVQLHDGREFTGTVRRDFRSDLALVKIDAKNLMPAELADSDAVKVGQWAIAFGSPFELSDTMTVGIVSAKHRQTTISDGSEQRDYPSLIQTDAAINPGNSGGPLVDIRGKVIGINVAINSPTGSSVGIAFAIPSNKARQVMEQLITTGRVTRGYLGLSLRDMTDDERKRYDVPKGGALVGMVVAGTPAEKAGIQVEDVVTQFDGKPVPDTITLTDRAASTTPNRPVPIVVKRAGKDINLTITPTVMPEDVAMGTSKPMQAGVADRLGLGVQAVSSANAQQFGLKAGTTGLAVTNVVNGSPADTAGLQPGDVILRVNGKTVATTSELANSVRSAKSGDTIALVIQRDNNRSLVTVKVP